MIASQVGYAARDTHRLEALERAARAGRHREARPAGIHLAIPRPARRLRPAPARRRQGSMFWFARKTLPGS